MARYGCLLLLVLLSGCGTARSVQRTTSLYLDPVAELAPNVGVSLPRRSNFNDLLPREKRREMARKAGNVFIEVGEKVAVMLIVNSLNGDDKRLTAGEQAESLAISAAAGIISSGLKEVNNHIWAED